MKSCCNPISAQQQPLDLVSASRFWARGRPPRRDAILDLLTTVVDWPALEAMIRPHYESDIRRRGRKGYSLRMMIRVTTLAWLWQASDRALEHAIEDSKSLARFIGTDPWAPRPPSATAIRSFRDLLTRTIGPDGVFHLHHHLADTLRKSIHASGLECRHGVLQEPLFRRSLSPIIRAAQTSAAPGDEGEAP